MHSLSPTKLYTQASVVLRLWYWPLAPSNHAFSQDQTLYANASTKGVVIKQCAKKKKNN